VNAPTPENLFVDVNGIKTHYIDQGDPSKPPILFIHGAFSSTAAWGDLFPFLEQDYRLIALDLISHGYTDRVLKPPITIDLIIDHIHGFVEALDLPAVPIVGNSFGCMVAVYYALQHPANVKGMVLLDGGLGKTAIPVKEIKGAPQLAAMSFTKYVGDALFPFIGKKMITDWYTRCLYDTSLITATRIENNQAPLRQKHSIKALNLLLRALFKFGDPKNYAELHVADRLPALEMPVSIAWGESDRILPRWIGEEMVQLLPHAQMQVIEKCGHLPHEECPQVVAKIIQEFMATMS